MILYHLTPTKNIPGIRKSGLKVGGGNVGGFAEGSVPLAGVYFFKSTKDLRDHADYNTSKGKWSLIKVNLPASWPLKAFEEYPGSGSLPGLTSFYSETDIPSKYIEVLHQGGSIAFDRPGQTPSKTDYPSYLTNKE
jgi:hypothetical protein